MTIPKEAIEKAIEGGWPANTKVKSFDHRALEVELLIDGLLGYVPYTFRMQEIALDPLFWQALGKSLGWDTLRYKGGTGDYPFNRFYYWRWQGEAHKFYQNILANGDTDAYWKEILTSK